MDVYALFELFLTAPKLLAVLDSYSFILLTDCNVCFFPAPVTTCALDVCLCWLATSPDCDCSVTVLSSSFISSLVTVLNWTLTYNLMNLLTHQTVLPTLQLQRSVLHVYAMLQLGLKWTAPSWDLAVIFICTSLFEKVLVSPQAALAFDSLWSKLDVEFESWCFDCQATQTHAAQLRWQYFMK